MTHNILSREAAQDYLHLLLLSFDHEIIGETVFLERLAVLATIGRHSDGAVVLAREILEDCEWPLGLEDWSDESSETPESQSREKDDDRSPGGQLDDQGDPFMRLVVNVDGNDWDFHPFDDDWFPSIPHGHKQKVKRKGKLDPYLGWMYEKSAQVGRIKRRSIIELWNDDQFRETARRAVDYYLQYHSNYTGWRVPNPRRLPNRR